jgi:pseudouridylate synthase
MALVSKRTGSTTVASTLAIAHMAGLRVFVTGGIGGVHR